VGTLGSIWRAMHATALELHLRQVGLRQRLKVGNNKLKNQTKTEAPVFLIILISLRESQETMKIMKKTAAPSF
jgi:hypothetical protein